MNISSAPNPEAIPFSSDPNNVQWVQDIKLDRKAARRPAPTTLAIKELQETQNTVISTLNNRFDSLNNTLTNLTSILTKNAQQQPVAQPTILSGINWTPLLQGLVSTIGQSLGANIQFAQPTSAEAQSVQPSVSPQLDSQVLSQLESKINALESKVDSQNNAVLELTNKMTELTNQLLLLAKNVNTVNDGLSKTNSQVAILFEAISSNGNNGNSNNGNPNNTPSSNGSNVPSQNAPTELRPGVPIISRPKPSRTSVEEAIDFLNNHELDEAILAPEFTNTSNTDPFIHNERNGYVSEGDSDVEDAIEDTVSSNLNKGPPSLEEETITQPINNILEEGPPKEDIKYMAPSEPYTDQIDIYSNIVTADLEAIIEPNGNNFVYMAAWYSQEGSNIFYVNPDTLNKEEFLKEFWTDLLNNNAKKTLYFHNFGGYDSILSLPSLLSSLPNLEFKPILKDGEILNLEVHRDGELLITIKDSIKLIPGSLSKLAKDWKVQTLKEHFPHYFWNNSIQTTLRYSGTIPPYECFEPKRTSKKDYEDMVKIFKNTPWSFLEVSKTYIMSDCIALFQVLIKFFETVREIFPMNPIKSVSAPSVAFKIWRTAQLPLLKTSVIDFSNTNWDNYLRQSYNGGIVDVYKFHLKTKGYYYDVNSLYPTAMCKPIPIGEPTKLDSQFWGHNFFGFVDATIRSSPDEYIGLLSIKWNGRLVCPSGTFRGLFFSEELLFALENGYTIVKIHNLIQFTKGEVFKELILKLNEMKITAQLEGKSTIRNLAKLLMNSMYGRFGMHTGSTQSAIITKMDWVKYYQLFEILSNIELKDYNIINYNYSNTEKIGNTKLEKIFKSYMSSLIQRTNVAIASAVTAYSRIIINQHKLNALKLGANLYYSDTDSMVIDRELPSTLVDSAKLGLLKLEHTIEEGLFALPKVYYLKCSDGTEVTKAKGYSGKLNREIGGSN